MKLISVNIPEMWLAAIEELVHMGHFPNRSEAIRAFVRDGIKAELLFQEEKAKKGGAKTE